MRSLCVGLVSLLATRATAQAREPIQLPLIDVQVDAANPDSRMYGIPARIGSPEQAIVMLPWAELNNTIIYEKVAVCKEGGEVDPDTACDVRRGHFYSSSQSSSFNNTVSLAAAGGAVEEASRGLKDDDAFTALVSSSQGATDTLFVGETGPLVRFPIAMPRKLWNTEHTYLHSLGLGRNSTYLNSLVASGQIASRVWSLFWGRMWTPQTPINGSLVLGGYDKQKITGANFTSPLDYSTGCWTGMPLQITGITVDTGRSGEQHIMPVPGELPVCLVPQYDWLVSLPESYLDTFEEVTKTPRWDWWRPGLHQNARIYNTSDGFTGDITLNFKSGLSVRVPNDQYLVPFAEVDVTGSRSINDTVHALLLNEIKEAKTLKSTLGRTFLTSAYLMVDYDAGTFTLWNANPTDGSQLEAVTHSSEPPPAAKHTDSSSASDASAAPAAGNSTSNTGAIAGGTVGGVVALLGLGFGVWFLIRRRRRTDQGMLPGSQDFVAQNEYPKHVPELDDRYPQDPSPQEQYAQTQYPKYVPELDDRQPQDFSAHHEQQYPTYASELDNLQHGYQTQEHYGSGPMSMPPVYELDNGGKTRRDGEQPGS